MSDLNLNVYETRADFFKASKTAVAAYAKTGETVTARVLAAVLFTRLDMPSASVEKVIDTAFDRITSKDNVAAGQVLANLRQKATKAIRQLTDTRELPKADGGTSEKAVLAIVQKALDVYTLGGLASAYDKARADKAAPKKAAAQTAKVEAAEAAHQAQREARAAMGVEADDTFDVLTLQRAIEALCAATDAGFAQGAMIEAMIEARLFERREARAAAGQGPLAIAA